MFIITVFFQLLWNQSNIIYLNYMKFKFLIPFFYCCNRRKRPQLAESDTETENFICKIIFVDWIKMLLISVIKLTLVAAPVLV